MYPDNPSFWSFDIHDASALEQWLKYYENEDSVDLYTIFFHVHRGVNVIQWSQAVQSG